MLRCCSAVALLGDSRQSRQGHWRIPRCTVLDITTYLRSAKTAERRQIDYTRNLQVISGHLLTVPKSRSPLSHRGLAAGPPGQDHPRALPVVRGTPREESRSRLAERRVQPGITSRAAPRPNLGIRRRV